MLLEFFASWVDSGGKKLCRILFVIEGERERKRNGNLSRDSDLSTKTPCHQRSDPDHRYRTTTDHLLLNEWPITEDDVVVEWE